MPVSASPGAAGTAGTVVTCGGAAGCGAVLQAPVTEPFLPVVLPGPPEQGRLAPLGVTRAQVRETGAGEGGDRAGGDAGAAVAGAAGMRQ